MSSNNDSQVERDREEVESLNRRLLERDMKATRNTSSLNPIAVDSEINKMSEEQKRSLVPQLRELSRQEYLQKREKMKLELLQKEVEEEEMVYSDSELTGREKRSREEKKVGDGCEREGDGDAGRQRVGVVGEVGEGREERTRVRAGLGVRKQQQLHVQHGVRGGDRRGGRGEHDGRDDGEHGHGEEHGLRVVLEGE